MKLKTMPVQKGAVAAMMLMLLVGCGSPEEKAKAYYQSGMEYLDKKDYSKAAIEFRNALKLDQNNAEAWFGLAQVEQQSQAWDRVYGNLSKVLEINPKHLKALMAISTLQSLAGDYKSALKNSDKALEIEPNNPDVLAQRAAILLKLNEKDAALGEAKKAIELKPGNSAAIAVLAAERMQGGDFSGAVTLIDKALETSPKELGLHLIKLSALEKLGDTAKQEAAIRTLIATFPDQPEFKKGLIDFLLAHSRNDDAEKELRAVLAKEPDNSKAGLELATFIMKTKGADAARAELVNLSNSQKDPFPFLMAIADVDYGAGRFNDAESLLRKLASANGVSENGIAALLKLNGQFIGQKKYAEALTGIAEVLKNDGENAEALKQRATIEIEQSNFEAAINDLRTALNNSVKDDKIHSLLAVAYERSGQIELAGRSLDEAAKLSNYAPATTVSYAAFLIRHGKDDVALDLLEDVVAKSPDSRDALVMLAELAQRKGNWRRAEEIAQRLRERDSSSAMSDQILGRSLLNQKRYDEAIALFSKAAGQSPQNREAMQWLFKAYWDAGKIDDAESYLDTALKDDPKNSDALLLMAMVQMRKAQPEKAKLSLDNALAAEPTSPRIYLALAEYYTGQKDDAAALDILMKGVSAAKDKNPVRLALATRYEMKGQFEDAIKQYETMVAESPGNLIATNNLVSLITDHRTDQADLDRATKLAGILKDSPIPAFRETLGWTLVRSGRVKEGLRLLEGAIDELADNPYVHYHIGVAYAQTGSKDLAKKHLEKAKELGVPAEISQQIDTVMATVVQANPQ